MRAIEITRSRAPQFIIDLGLAGWRKMTGKTKRLFRGDDQLFKSLVRKAKIYGEYGMGSSTIWVLDNCNCTVMAVDSDAIWVGHVKEKAGSLARLLATHTDLGSLARMGRPKSYHKRENFIQYCTAIWQHQQKPDLVLIDGRFRVCCFLSTLVHAAPGTKILFDDYVRRPIYHVVEDYVEPSNFCGRQALFIVPEGLNREEIAREMERFAYVMD